MEEKLDLVERDNLIEACMRLRDWGAELLARSSLKGYRSIKLARDNVSVAVGNRDGDANAYVEPIRKFCYETLRGDRIESDDIQKLQEIMEHYGLMDILLDVVKQVNGEDEKKHSLKLSDFEDYLYNEGVSVYRNVVTHEAILRGYPGSLNSFVTQCYSDLVDRYARVNENVISRYVETLIESSPINPVWERIKSVEWDGVDRIESLCDALWIEPEDKLSRLLVRKFLYQAIMLVLQKEPAANDEGIVSLRTAGVLALPGVQGAGKSTLISVLAFGDPALTCDQPLFVDDKDSVARCTSIWLGELSEVAGILNKSDRNRLKQFLTSTVDKYRPPYDRYDREFIRRTSFIATTNDDEFLDDPTGNRRWWTILCKLEEHGNRYDFDKENSIDKAQLWKQCYEETRGKGESVYNLTHEEMNQLAERNKEFEKPLPAEMELTDYMEKYQASKEKGQDTYELAYQTATDIKRALVLSYSPQQISSALRKMGIECRRRTSAEGVKGAKLYYFPKYAPPIKIHHAEQNSKNTVKA